MAPAPATPRPASRRAAAGKKSRPGSRGTTYVRSQARPTSARSEPEPAASLGCPPRPVSARSHHVSYTPERRDERDECHLPENVTELSSRIREMLVPYRVHEPASHSQHVAQMCYEKFKLVEPYVVAGKLKRKVELSPSAALFRPQPLPGTYHLLPSAWRPSADSVAAEAAAAGTNMALAAASLVAGRDLATALGRPRPESRSADSGAGAEFQILVDRLQKDGTIDVKAWIRFANAQPVPTRSVLKGGSKSAEHELPSLLAMPEKVLAAVALLFDVTEVRAVDLSGMGLESAPASLRAYPGLHSVDLSLNKPLTNLGVLAACNSVKAVSLSGCQKLVDLSPLAAIPSLRAVDLSSCESLGDVAPLLAGGYHAPNTARGPRPSHAAPSSEGATAAPKVPLGEGVPAPAAGLSKQTPASKDAPEKADGLQGAAGPEPSMSSRRATPRSRPSHEALVAQAVGGIGKVPPGEGAPRGEAAPGAVPATDEGPEKASKRPQSAQVVTERGRSRLAQEEVLPLGHPTLAWLGLSGCRALCAGADLLPRCQALAYVDFFDCHALEPFDCYTASLAPQVENLVWPSVDMLGTFAKAAALPPSKLRLALESAAAAVEVKQLLASSGSRGCGLPPMVKLEAAAAREAARRAGVDVGLAADASKQALSSAAPMFPELAEGEDVDEKPEPEASDLSTMSAVPGGKRSRPLHCISALSFSRGLRAAGWKGDAELQNCQLFRIIDADRDGWLSREDFKLLERPQLSMEALEAGMWKLLHRNSCDHEVAAADLAGNRSKIDKTRMVECMVIAGIDNRVAADVSELIIYCAEGILPALDGRPNACRAALTHGLSCHAVAHTASLVSSFRQCLKDRFKDCKEAFGLLDVAGTGTITWEDFQMAVKEKLEWQDAAAPGVLEAVFRVLNRDGGEGFAAKDLAVLENFDAPRTLGAMESAARSLIKFPRERHERLVKINLDVSAKDDKPNQRGIGRMAFVECWKELGRRVEDVDAKMVFSLLDFASENRIYRDRMLVLCDAIPRRGEFASLGKLSYFLKQHFGSMEAAFSTLLTASAAEKEQSSSRDKRSKDKRGF